MVRDSGKIKTERRAIRQVVRDIAVWSGMAALVFGRRLRSSQVLMSVEALRCTIRMGVIFSTIGGLACAAQGPAAWMGVFDTGNCAPAALSGRAIANKPGWITLPEENVSHKFNGDAVLANDRITVVFRHGGPGAELYARGAEGFTLRAALAPRTGKPAARLTSSAMVANTASEASLDATFTMPDGKDAVVRFEIQPGQVFVRTEARRGVERLRVESPCRFAVLPDFFADDITVDAAELPMDRAELPGENFLLHMVGDGEAIVLAVRSRREGDIEVALAGTDKARAIQASDFPYGTRGSVYVAVLEGRGAWHWHDVRKEDAGRVIRLQWKAPFAAHWRMNWRQDDGLTDSWDMLLQQRDGSYVKPGWFGQPADYGTPGWMQSGRNRWTTVLGSFDYPCWIDQDGQGFLQPLKQPGNLRGPALLYPVARVAKTPLSAFTFVDIVRATLGVGPCEYVLDVEGQKRQSEGVPTCGTRAKLDAIYAKGEQRRKRAEVQQTLRDVLVFIRHIRARIDAYVAFSHQMRAYLAEQKKARPDLAKFLSDLEMIAGRIDAAVASRKSSIHTPEYAAGLVDEFRTTLVDYEGDDAQKKCERITAAFVEVGGSQDELVAECRVAVRILRQKAALAAAIDPRTAAIATEIRRRTQVMLRSPTSLEAPRH